MPLLDIAIPQPCSYLGNSILAFNSDKHLHKTKLAVGNGRGFSSLSSFSWKTLYVPSKVHLGRTHIWRHRLKIDAVATLEVTGLGKEDKVKAQQHKLVENVQSEKPDSMGLQPQSSVDDSREVDDREKLRRMRISKANKGNRPWNLGRKHSPETLRLIRERTRIAMQDPKVKMKLVNLGHAQSKETRVKIGVGVRLGWEKRREKLILQENCHYFWQNLIANSARKGPNGEDEFEWDSYEKQNEELEQEWLQSVEERKKAQRPKGSKRAPKSAEQKKKIAEAIAAKWADPNYRNRVCSGLAKFHGTEGIERNPRRKSSVDGLTQRASSPKQKNENENSRKRETKPHAQVQQLKPKRSKAPLYKDPQANSKLEMLKNIRAQRVSPMNAHGEVIARAKLLIAEAEKAAAALEIPAMTSTIAKASLIESRKLIAEAIRVIESIKEDGVPSEDDFSDDSIEQPSQAREDRNIVDGNAQNQEVSNQREKVNGVHSFLTSGEEFKEDFDFDKLMLPYMAANGNGSPPQSNDTLRTEEDKVSHSNGFLQSETENASKNSNVSSNGGIISPMPEQKQLVNGLAIQPKGDGDQKKQKKITKKWVRGRLVEVAEEV